MGLPHPAADPAVTDALSHVLGNTLCLALATQAFGWNCTGPGSLAIRQTLRSQHLELTQAMDLLADLARGAGAQVLADDSDGLIARERRIAVCAAGRDSMLEELVSAHLSMAASVEAAIEVARSAYDETVIAALGWRLVAHRCHVAALASESGGVRGA